MKITKIALIALISALTGIFTISIDSFAKGRTKGSTVRQRNVGFRDVVVPQVTEVTPEVPADAVVIDQKEVIQKAIAETELVEQNAMSKMNEARQQLLAGELTPAQAMKIINEQNSIIAQAKQELKKTIAKSVEKVEKSDAEQSYLNYFTSGAQSLASRALAPFKAGYGYTEEEKELAKKTIKGLKKQKEQLTADYEKARKVAPDYTARVDLKKRYDAITTELDNEIYQQQLITGEVMSTQRKLFWAAVVTGGAVAGLAALSSQQKAAELSQLQQEGGEAIAYKAAERAREKDFESMEANYIKAQEEAAELAQLQQAGEEAIAYKAAERAREKDFESMETDYIKAQEEAAELAQLQQEGEEAIARKATERAQEKEFEAMEADYIKAQEEAAERAQLQQAGEEAIALKAAERAQEKEFESMEAGYIKAQEEKVEQARLAKEQADRLAEGARVKAESDAAEAARVAEEARLAKEKADRLAEEARVKAEADAAAKSKGQEEDLEMAKIRAMESEKASVEVPKIKAREAEIARIKAELKAKEDWPKSPEYLTMKQNEEAALRREKTAIEKSLEKDKDELINLTGNRLLTEEEGGLFGPISSWWQGRNIAALEEKIAQGERALAAKDAQIKQVREEIGEVPLLTRASVGIQKIPGTISEKIFGETQETETPAEKAAREIREAVERDKKAQADKAAADRAAQEAAEQKQRVIDVKRQREAAEQERLKKAQADQENKEKAERKAIKKARKETAAQLKKEAEEAKVEADRLKAERNAEIKRIAALKQQRLNKLAAIRNEEKKGENMNLDRIKQLQTELADVEQELGLPVKENLFGNFFD